MFHLAQSFPTPMEEPKKILKAQYLGSTEVNQPTGMEVLNAAIDTAHRECKLEQWENVNVAVAPSMISINSSEVFFRLSFCIPIQFRLNEYYFFILSFPFICILVYNG